MKTKIFNPLDVIVLCVGIPLIALSYLCYLYTQEVSQ